MKNSRLLTELLDECAENLRLIRTGDIADLEELGRRYEADRTGQLWRALLADGWTTEELNAAYIRRFGIHM
jgi:hypothetical protein